MINQILTILLFTILITGYADYAVSGAPENDSLSRAQTYLEQGQYFLALQVIDDVLKNVSASNEQAHAYGLKGNILLRMAHSSFDRTEKCLLQTDDLAEESQQQKDDSGNNLAEAEKCLLKAYELSEESQQKAGYANSLAVLYHEKHDSKQREEYFKKALELAGSDLALGLKIKLNQLRTQSGSIDQSSLNKLLSEIANIDSPDERTRYYLNLAEIAKSVDQKNQTMAQFVLEKAYAARDNITDKQLSLELLNSLADVYETQGQDQRALELNEQASVLARQMDADDLMMHIEWRKGEIYQRRGEDDHALAAFGKAFDYAQTLRMDIPVKYINGESSFRKTLEPIYLGYTHHLLKKSIKQEGEAKQETLKLARKAIEQIKQTELVDYLGERCLIEGVVHSELDSMDEQAAILYPIILEDRLELLVGIGKTIRQYTYTEQITKERIEKAANDISNSLRTRLTERKENYQRSAENLYQWIIAPIEKDLIKYEIKTLVIVPDGKLRLVPFAALSDGKQFLVEKYALSVSPGMSLLSSSKDAKKPREYSMLSVGLKTPGPVVEKLLKQRLLQQQGGAEFINQYPESFDDLVKATQEKGILLQVETELKNISNIDALKNVTLLNEQFTVANFNQLIKEKPYEIIHIASHGSFSSDENSNYLMAYDDTLKLEGLRKTLKRDQDAGGSLQLLTLSACQTAEGDDSAPLGFTGAALKAEALSALGSLWPVSDKATAQLMANFYKHLTQHRGKAESLRQAQRELLNNPDLQDPFYWAPFILVGSWL